MALFDNPANMLGMFAAFAGAIFFIGIIFYVYFALALMTVAKKLKDPQPWLAWIPIANLVLMARLAKMHWWPVLLLIAMIIPFLNFVAMIVFTVFVLIWTWKICEARKRPRCWAILQLIPVVGSVWGLIMWGILAWSK